jgi:hypothetical protein
MRRSVSMPRGIARDSPAVRKFSYVGSASKGLSCGPSTCLEFEFHS